MSGYHTPGAWAFRQIDNDGLGYIEVDGRDIMHAGVTDRPAIENIANARLTAAAPDLLEALQAAVANSDAQHADGVRRIPGTRIEKLYKQAKAAIAKATAA